MNIQFFAFLWRMRCNMKNKRRKPNLNKKICERCGNGGYTARTMFRCKYCGWMNGCEEYGVEITRGGIDDR